MNGLGKGIVVAAIVLSGAFAWAQKPAAPRGAVRDNRFSFTPFNSSQKNMNTHGLILDSATGEGWVVTQGAEFSFIAAPISYEVTEASILATTSAIEALHTQDALRPMKRREQADRIKADAK